MLTGVSIAGLLCCAPALLSGPSRHRITLTRLSHAALIGLAVGLADPQGRFAAAVMLILLIVTDTAVVLARTGAAGGMAAATATAGLAGIPPFGMFPGLVLLALAAAGAAPWLLLPIGLGVAAILIAGTPHRLPAVGRMRLPSLAWVPLGLALAFSYAAPEPLVSWIASITAGCTMTIAGILGAAELVPCHPWPRYLLPQDAWSAFVQALPGSPTIFLALWADTVQVHVLLLDEAGSQAICVSTVAEGGCYHAVSPFHPNAGRFERMIADLWGHVAEGAIDHRPSLDHGRWPQSRPMAARPDPPRLPDQDDELVENNEPLMQLSVGPIHGRLEEAVRLRLLVRDGTIRSAEGQLGFTHKGTLMLMRGKSPRTAARFAARLAADTTVAHSIAFASAAEAALGVEPPPRAVTLRAVMLELERIACHLDNLGEIGRLAEARTVWTQCGMLREHLLRATAGAFGHRLMMDCVVPGGVALDIAETGTEMILRALGHIASGLPALHQSHDGTVLAARLSGLGRTGLPLLHLLGAGGPVARAAGRAFDTWIPSGASSLARTPARSSDALGRQHTRIEEIAGSLTRVGRMLRALPPGPLTVALPQDSGEGIGYAESARGAVWHWLRLDHGQIGACFPRDPGWALWPVAESVLINAAAEDAELIRTSFALPASGMDL